MSDTLCDKVWDNLLRSIRNGQCTPFIGAGACAGTLPLGSEIARQWAEEYGYPLADATDLARVAQFLAIDRYGMFPKESIEEQFQGIASPDFSEPDEPHSVLADLKLPIYVTTNYDSFMVEALKHHKRDPKQEFCRWNDYIEVTREESVFDTAYKPTPSNPLVYHLHGHIGLPQSMVLTEGDYLDFLIRLTRDQDLLPPAIRMALTGTHLLFIGYRLADWNFRVILRGLRGALEADLQYPVIAVQLPPDKLSGEQNERAQKYLDEYLSQIGDIKTVCIYWGDARQFARELRERWEAWCDDNWS